MSGLAKRSFTLSRHRTSVALEPVFWSALEQLASRQGRSLAALLAAADRDRDPGTGLASLLRVLVVTELAGSGGSAGHAVQPEKTCKTA